MNSLEVIRILNRMVDQVRRISIEEELSCLLHGLIIDKNRH